MLCALFWGGVGFVIGWVVFKRPAWAEKLWQKLKAKLNR